VRLIIHWFGFLGWPVVLRKSDFFNRGW
jgi:hypothetical protein